LSEIRYRADIDGLRALAVGAVVVFHTVPSLLPGGYLGVDIFFVISGYLITGMILAGRRAGTFSVMDFYLRRARRILPALLVMLAVVLLLGLLILMPDELERLACSAAASAVFVPNFLFLSEAGYFDAAADSKPLLHLWSLGVEEQFYLAWPALLLLLAPRGRPAVALGAIGVLGAASFVAYLLIMRGSPEAAFFLPFTRFWELLIGASLAAGAASETASRPDAIRSGARSALAWTGLALMLGAIALAPPGADGSALIAAGPTVGAALFIAAGPLAMINRTVFAWRPVVYVGLISYPLYLWHWPLLSYVRILHLPDVGLDRQLRLVAIAVSVVAAVLTYQYVELPVRRRRDLGRLGVRLMGTLAGVGLLALSLQASHGLPQRTPLAVDPFAWPESLRFDDPCLARYGQPEKFRSEAFCVRNDAAREPAIVVIGDSHANALWPGVEAVHHAESVLQIGGSACPFLRRMQFWREDAPSHREVCVPLIDAAYDAITPATRVVILAARSTIYATPEKSRDYGARGPVHLRSLDFPQAAPLEAYERGLASDLARLLESGVEVLLVLQVPELDFSPRTCLAIRPFQRLLPSGLPPHRCTMPRRDVEAGQAAYRAVVARVVASLASPRLRVLDPMDVLCDANECHAMLDGVLMYRDEDHLGIAGSRLVWTRLEARAGLPPH